MIVKNINLVEIEAEGDKYLTDSENTNTFKKVTCRAEDVSKYIEISKERAKEIKEAIEKASEIIEDVVENIIDGITNIQN